MLIINDHQLSGFYQAAKAKTGDFLSLFHVMLFQNTAVNRVHPLKAHGNGTWFHLTFTFAIQFMMLPLVFFQRDLLLGA